MSVKDSQEQDSKLEVEEVTNIYTAIILLLQMINELFVMDEDHTKGIKHLLVGANALSLVTGKYQSIWYSHSHRRYWERVWVDILGHLEQIKLPPVQQENPLVGFNFLKRECIRLIGTLCYKDIIMQDKVNK